LTDQGHFYSDMTRELKAGFDQLNQRADSVEQQEERKKTLNWFSNVDHVSQQQDVIAKRQAKTGSWLLDSDEFKKWSDTPGNTILCPGAPGAGKTVLSAIVIDHFQDKCRVDTSVDLAYFYFNYKNRQENAPDFVLGSLLRQLLEPSKIIPTEILRLYEERKGKARPSKLELHEAFKAVVPNFLNVHIIIDALDECYASDTTGLKLFIEDLFRLQRSFTFNVFATTRHISDITSLFRGCIHQSIKAHEEDVGVYIESRLHELLRGKLCKYKPEDEAKISLLKKEVKTSILKATDGM
jgi:Cdc6-like AAA superfamily ATPase